MNEYVWTNVRNKTEIDIKIKGGERNSFVGKLKKI